MNNYYKRKSDRKLVFTEELMQQIQAEIANGKSKRQISRELKIPEATLRKRLKCGTIPKSLGRFKCVFSKDMETQLADYVREMDLRFYGLTRKDLKHFAFEYAEINGIEHPFDMEKKAAGDKWVRNFCSRQKMTHRQPEKCSMGRIMGFNKPQVERFFHNLNCLYKKFNFSPRRIFNMDESGLSTVPNKLPRIVTKKGKRAVGKVASAKRGQLITAVCCISASGEYIAPALIFPRKRMREDLFKDAPNGTLKMISDSGFINADLFVKWIQHFKEVVKPSQEEPVILLFDNHVSHRTLNVVNYCRKNFIHLLSLPPHSSHRLQPLDKGFFGPLKAAYSQFCDSWLVSHPGKVITQSEVAGLFRQAYYKVANIEKAVNSFASTGIYPFNSQVFQDDDFAPSAVSERPKVDCQKLVEEQGSLGTRTYFGDQEQTEKEEPTCSSSNEVLKTCMSSFSTEDAAGNNNIIIEVLDQSNAPGTYELLKAPITVDLNQVEIIDVTNSTMIIIEEGTKKNRIEEVLSDSIVNESSPVVSPYEIRPLPKMEFTCARKRKAQRSEILTSTPFKESLDEAASAANIALVKKNKTVKRRIQDEDNTASPTQTSKSQPCTSRKSTSRKYKKTEKAPTDITLEKTQTENPEEEVFCPGCNEQFVDPPDEDWIQCIQCTNWWHEACTFYSGGQFICDFCK